MKNTIEKLRKFVNQKPGLEFANYGDVKIYRSEMNEITKDLHDYRELISLAFQRIENLNEKLTDYLNNTSGRLLLNKDNELEYHTGQYFPTEYRPAANRVLVSLIWDDYRKELNENNEPVYKTGNEIRSAIKRRVSRRVYKNYFQ